MMKFLLGGAMMAALATAAAATAQPAPPTPPGVAQGTTAVPALPPARVETRVHRMPMMMPETRAEMVAHIREMFARLDANRDGVVTRAEADAAHKNMPSAFRHKIAEHRGGARHDSGGGFDRLDANKDGMISRQEFDARRQVRKERRVAMIEGDPSARRPIHEMGMRLHGRMFEMADANNDGRVSLQEMTDAALRHFDMADANRDGRITPDERMRMHQHMRTGRRPA